MTEVVCISVPSKLSDLVRTVFGNVTHVFDISALPIGKHLAGGNRSWSSYALYFDGGGSVFGSHPAVFANGVMQLIAQPDIPALYFIVHWQADDPKIEVIAIQDTLRISPNSAAFLSIYDDEKPLRLKREVRYILRDE